MSRTSRAATAILLLAAPPLCLPAAAAAQEPEVVDRILAVVDEDPILQSEVDQLIGLGLVERREDESEEQYRRRVLASLIDQRLRFHAIDRFGFGELPINQLERQYEAFRQSFADSGEFDAKLAELGLDESSLRQLVARQLMVVTYVEERLGPRVFVSLDEITAYYDDVLTPEMAARGQPLPPLAEVREEIREVVKQRRLNEEIERWTEELRQRADIEDYSESGHDSPPAFEPTGG